MIGREVNRIAINRYISNFLLYAHVTLHDCLFLFICWEKGVTIKTSFTHLVPTQLPREKKPCKDRKENDSPKVTKTFI